MVISYLKSNGTEGFLMYNANDELIATVNEPKKGDSDYGQGAYRICICRGIASGKVVYARDFQHLNDKGVEIATLPREQGRLYATK